MKYLVTLTRTVKVEAKDPEDARGWAETVWDYGGGGDTEDYEVIALEEEPREDA